MNRKLKLFCENENIKTNKGCKSNYCKKFLEQLFNKNNIYKFISLGILFGSFFYFSYTYINNNSQYYVQISKGIVAPKHQLAGSPVLFE